MRTPETILPVRAHPSEHLRIGTAVDGLLESLPSLDPISAQKVVCEAIAQLRINDQSDAGQLEALLMLDRHAQHISRRLLKRYVEGGAQMRSFERSVWVSASRLSQSFYQAYEHVFRHLQSVENVDWHAQAGSVLVALFHHREIELLLRFIRFKKRIPGQWKELHEIYAFAIRRGMTTDGTAAGQTEDARGAPATLEKVYIRLLLLELMNNGQFSPREALWASAWFPRWCTVLHLQSRGATGPLHTEPTGFNVDLDATDGLKRAVSAAAGNVLFLDPSPLMAVMDTELESLRSSDALRGESALAERAGKIALLKKLGVIFDPRPVRIARRGDRKPVALAVQAIIGLSNIIQVLREEARSPNTVRSTQEPQPEGITISPLGAATYSPGFAADRSAGPATVSIADGPGVAPSVWQVKDRSDSGSRMRGTIDDLNRVIPGSLIAIREGEGGSWTVSVVRRFRRLMIDYIEIGVEHIGRRPRFVKMVAEPSGSAAADPPADSAQSCFAALYLPPSERQPTMPIKTLLLPARHFKPDGTVTLLSSNATYTLRLNEPIQQQFEFVWTSFTVIDKAHVASGRKPTAVAGRR